MAGRAARCRRGVIVLSSRLRSVYGLALGQLPGKGKLQAGSAPRHRAAAAAGVAVKFLRDPCVRSTYWLASARRWRNIMTLPWSGFSTISHWQRPSCSVSSGCAGDSNSCVFSNVCTSTSPPTACPADIGCRLGLVPHAVPAFHKEVVIRLSSAPAAGRK
jgi:hypothetical protein